MVCWGISFFILRLIDNFFFLCTWTFSQVRKMAYVKGNSSPYANLDVLDKLIATRHSLAQVIHADFLSLKFVKNRIPMSLIFPFIQYWILKMILSLGWVILILWCKAFHHFLWGHLLCEWTSISLNLRFYFTTVSCRGFLFHRSWSQHVCSPNRA